MGFLFSLPRKLAPPKLGCVAYKRKVSEHYAGDPGGSRQPAQMPPVRLCRAMAPIRTGDWQ